MAPPCCTASKRDYSACGEYRFLVDGLFWHALSGQATDGAWAAWPKREATRGRPRPLRVKKLNLNLGAELNDLPSGHPEKCGGALGIALQKRK